MAKNKEVLKGGNGDNEPDASFDKDTLEEGAEHEKEHTKSKKASKEIAKDHLTERPDYYKKLGKMEAEGPAEEAQEKLTMQQILRAVMQILQLEMAEHGGASMQGGGLPPPPVHPMAQKMGPPGMGGPPGGGMGGPPKPGAY